MRHFVFAFFAAFLIFALPAGAHAGEDGAIGTIIEIEGVATVKPSGEDKKVLMIDSPVYVGDMIETQSNSRVFILFIDNTQMVLSEKTKFSADEYIFDTENPSASMGAFSVLTGAFSYVSGLIAKKSSPDVTINTAVGSIGIRGTEFFAGEVDGGYNVFVDEGKIQLVNDGGEVMVKEGEGTSVHNSGTAPLPARAWSPEKRQAARAKVLLRRADIVRERLATVKAKHPQLRERYRKHLESRWEKIQERREKGEKFRNRQWNRDTEQNPQDLKFREFKYNR